MSILLGSSTLAQITPDDTLRTQRSVVTPDVNINRAIADRIDGGVIRGTNLFHSFLEFNIGDGQRVYFLNPAGIENILTRVTGNNVSNILGTLGVTGGNANLFFINPNGIIFGRNARLDIRGSFVATTANAIQLGNQGFFSASTPESSSLLSINPAAFFFNQITAQPITNQARLQVPESRSLILVGGDVVINGGRLNAPDGRVELAGVAGTGTVGLNVDGNELSLNIPDNLARADISLTNAARVNVNGEGGGFIQVKGDRITVADASEILAETEGNQNGKGILIQATQLVVRDGSQISSSALEGSQGDSGGITVNVSESVELIGTSSGNQGGNSGNGGGGGSGNGGGGDSGDNEKPSKLASDAQGAGKAGDLLVNTRRLVVRDGARISASTIDRSGGGSLTVNASESVEVSGASSQRQRPSALTVQTRGIGQDGSLTINTGRLLVRDGAEVSASTFGAGGGGDVIVNASESVQVIGSLTTSDGELPSQIVADTGRLLNTRDVGTIVGTGQGGNLNITAGQLVVQDGGQVSARSLGLGNGGSLTVKATDSVQLSGTGSGLFVNATSGSTAGNLTVETGQMSVSNGAEVTVSSPTGQAGNMFIQANSLALNQGRLFAETAKSGAEDGADITLSGLDLLRMDNESRISANALEQANGGNVTIDSTLVVATPPTGSKGSDITANAVRGNGGRVNITTQGLFGIEFRPELTPENDITVSSVFGLTGEFQLNSPEVDPTRGLTNLPTDVTDASNQIAQTCTTDGGQVAQNAFIITGRGGLPSNPYEPLTSSEILADVQPPTEWRLKSQASGSSSTTSTTTRNRIIEAQGWIINENGEVVLIAEVPSTASQSGCVLR